jgi:hypothetical protein
VFSRARRETGHGGARVKSDRRRPSSKAVVGVEPLEGRMLLSYLVVVKNHKVIPVHGGDARVAEPLFGNGLAFKKQANFYTFYDGPRTPNLDGVSATAVFSGNRVTDGTLTLTGTMAGPIIAKPTKASQEAIYTFAIDRGGAAKAGPFPGRSHIRFDAVVVVPLTLGGITAKNPPYVQINDASINTPLATTTIDLSTSSVKIKGDTLTVAVPLGTSTTNPIPSTGKAIDQWNFNFFIRHPSPYGSGKNGYHSIASFTPEETMFQPYIQHFKPIRATNS